MDKLHKHNLRTLKPLHRAVETAVMTQGDVNAALSRNWPVKLSPAVENTFFQIKEEQVQTREVLAKRWQATSGSTKCRFCHVAGESLDHILSDCPVLSLIAQSRP